MKVEEHQQRVLKKLERTPKLLVYHGTGSGKTLTTLLAAKKEKAPLTVIGPAALKHNFPKERVKHRLSSLKINYHSYAKPPDLTDPETVARISKSIVAFDEAHRMGRIESKRSRYPELYRGKKELYLTATPIRNTPDELIPILRGLDINVPRDRSLFNKIFVREAKIKPGIIGRLRGIKPGVKKIPKNLEPLRQALKGKVDYHAPSKKGYPTVEEEVIKTDMSKRQMATYRMALKGKPNLAYKVKHGIPPSKSEAGAMNAFLSASRQISNTPAAFNLSADTKDSPKIMKAVKEIKKHHASDPNYRGVTYSTFLGSGVDAVEGELKRLRIPYARFTGQTSKEQRKAIIKAYNTGRVKHLLISGSGAEGLDLKGTKLMQMLEPYWNEPRLQQVKGRAIRFKSHTHLPKGEQKVKVQKFISTVPKSLLNKLKISKKKLSTDEYISMLAKNKRELVQPFLGVLKTAKLEVKSMEKYFKKEAGAEKFFIPGGAVAGGAIGGIAGYRGSTVKKKSRKEKIKKAVPIALGGAVIGGLAGLRARDVYRAVKSSKERFSSAGSAGWGGGSFGGDMIPGRKAKEAYKFFGLKRSPKTKKTDVKEAWRNFMREHHPDKVGDDPVRTRRAKEATQHWHEISRKDKDFFDKLGNFFVKLSARFTYTTDQKLTTGDEPAVHGSSPDEVIKKCRKLGIDHKISRIVKVAETTPAYKKTKNTPTTQAIIALGEEWINRVPPKGVIKEVKKTTFNKIAFRLGRSLESSATRFIRKMYKKPTEEIKKFRSFQELGKADVYPIHEVRAKVFETYSSGPKGMLAQLHALTKQVPTKNIPRKAKHLVFTHEPSGQTAIFRRASADIIKSKKDKKLKKADAFHLVTILPHKKKVGPGYWDLEHQKFVESIKGYYGNKLEFFPGETKITGDLRYMKKKQVMERIQTPMAKAAMKFIH